MGTLTESEFVAALAEFVDKSNQESKEKWTLHKNGLGVGAKQSLMVKWRQQVVNRQLHITYNNTYQVPVLWFNIFRRDGLPLTAEEALELSSADVGPDIGKNISQNEHPLLGVLFYNIHPCNTPQIMKELTGNGNYIGKWLSVYGSPIGVRVTSSLFGDCVTSSFSSQLSHCSETSHSSEDGSLL